MSIFGAFWKTVGWIALAVGLYLNGNLDEINEPVSAIRLELSMLKERQTLPTALREISSIPCAIAVELSGADIETFEEWIAKPPSGTATLTFFDSEDQPVRTWTIEGEELDQVATDAASGIIVAESTTSTTDATSLQVKSNLGGRFLATHRPTLILGQRLDDGLHESVGKWVKRRDPRPGITLLLGGSLVFLQLFFVLARLIVPDCAPTEHVALS